MLPAHHALVDLLGKGVRPFLHKSLVLLAAAMHSDNQFGALLTITKHLHRMSYRCDGVLGQFEGWALAKSGDYERAVSTFEFSLGKKGSLSIV